MKRPAPAGPGGTALRVTILVLLTAAPLLAGAVHAPVFIPLLLGCGLVGGAALLRSWRRRQAEGPQARVPGTRAILALHVLVLLQLVPLPPSLLRLASPGSYSFYNDPLLVPSPGWHPVSVSPPDTLRGLGFLAGFSLLYFAVQSEMTGGRWRRRLLLTVVGTGLALTLVAFVQSMSPEPRRIYGVWRPRWDWAVFGPYVNRSHFAGYLLMAIPLAIGFSLESWRRFAAAWRKRRHRRLLVLGEAEANDAIRASVVVMVLVAGLFAAGSRGGVGAFVLTALLLPLAARQRARVALLIGGLAGLGVAWIGLGGFFAALEQRGIRASRVDLWLDILPMVRRFPVFGTGLDAFSTAYPWYQTVGTDWVGEAHNEDLQALVDMGVLGAGLVAWLLFTVFRRALARAPRGGVELGVLGALLGVCFANLVDFNWQIPANAATWIALAAVTCRERAVSNDSCDPA